MVEFVLCDDNALHNQTLSHHLSEIISGHSLDARIALCTTRGEDVVGFAGTTGKGRRIYMLDLVLEQKFSGLDLCDAVHKYDPEAYVIYVSAYPEYALECCQSHAFDFLLKPYTRERLEESVLAALRDQAARRPGYAVIVRAGSRMERLDQREIYYIEANHDHVTAFFAQDKKFSWCEGLGKLEERLPPDRFLRIHRSFLVNREHVASIDFAKGMIALDDGRELPMSRRCAAQWRKRRSGE